MGFLKMSAEAMNDPPGINKIAQHECKITIMSYTTTVSFYMSLVVSELYDTEMK